MASFYGKLALAALAVLGLASVLLAVLLAPHPLSLALEARRFNVTLTSGNLVIVSRSVSISVEPGRGVTVYDSPLCRIRVGMDKGVLVVEPSARYLFNPFCWGMRVVIGVPGRVANLSLNVDAGSVVLEDVTVGRLQARLVASTARLNATITESMVLEATASTVRARVSAPKSARIVVDASSSTLSLVLGSRGARVQPVRVTASSFSVRCGVAPGPLVLVSARASSVRVVCEG